MRQLSKRWKKAIEEYRFRRAYRALYGYRLDPAEFAKMAGLPEKEAWEKLRRVRRAVVGCPDRNARN